MDSCTICVIVPQFKRVSRSRVRTTLTYLSFSKNQTLPWQAPDLLRHPALDNDGPQSFVVVFLARFVVSDGVSSESGKEGSCLGTRDEDIFFERFFITQMGSIFYNSPKSFTG